MFMFEKKINELEIKSEKKYYELLEDTNKNLYKSAISQIISEYEFKQTLFGSFILFGFLASGAFLFFLVSEYFISLAFIGFVIYLFLSLRLIYLQTKIKNPYEES